MEKEKIEAIKNELEDEKAMLEVKIDALEGGEDFGSDVDSLEEETDESEAWGNQTSAAQVLRARLADIETALEKIEKGTFGVCEECGEAMGADLIQIDASSRLCRPCKKLARDPQGE